MRQGHSLGTGDKNINKIAHSGKALKSCGVNRHKKNSPQHDVTSELRGRRRARNQLFLEEEDSQSM